MLKVKYSEICAHDSIIDNFLAYKCILINGLWPKDIFHVSLMKQFNVETISTLNCFLYILSICGVDLKFLFDDL